jgi:glycosyltransferase involved in cell wall biosynthesis
MKIAIINNLYFPFNHGGAEQVVKKMIVEAQNSGHEVFLISTKPYRTKIPYENKALKASNSKSESSKNSSDLKIYYLNSLLYNLHKIPIFLRFFWHLNNFLLIGKYFKIKKILKINKPDLVITHNLLGLGFLVPRAIKKLKIRHEHVLHDIQLLHPSGLLLLGQEKIIDKLPAKIYQFLTRKLFSSPSKIISPSSWLLKEHLKRKFFPNSLQEIRTFNFDKGESVIARTENINKNTNTWLFVGQIENHKGILWLISAFKKIEDPKLKLIIVGDGQKLILAKELARTDHRLQFYGQLNSEEVKKIMISSDYLIVPSLCYENSPTVIYEAHKFGLPVIAAKLGGIAEITGPEDCLFQAGNENDLKRCWQAIKNQKELQS